MTLTEEEKISISKQVLQAKENGRKLWADFEANKDKKDFLVQFSKDNGFSIDTKSCPRNLWTIIIRW